MVRTLAPGNRIRLLTHGPEARQSAQEAVGDCAEVVPAAYGDIWLRDTGPIFAASGGAACALRFRTNGWGGKFPHPDDNTVGDEIAHLAGIAARHFDFVLEGGAIDHDGAGTFLATRQTLLNANRNGWSERDAEAALRDALGARKVLWLDEGLIGDHTDGHVDNVARFVGPAQVVVQEPACGDDPNKEQLEAIAPALEGATDANGRAIEISTIPSPGRVLNGTGDVAPASYLNFAIANGLVAVPVFGTNTQRDALRRLQAAFPDRKVVGLPALGLLGAGNAGGGAFHCITREEPDFAQERLSSR